MKKETKKATTKPTLQNKSTDKPVSVVSKANTGHIEDKSVDVDLYLELLDCLNQNDDKERTLKLLKQILTKEPNNPKIKELLEFIEKEKSEEESDEDEDKFLQKNKMQLNQDGEYEYVGSDEEEEEIS